MRSEPAKHFDTEYVLCLVSHDGVPGNSISLFTIVSSCDHSPASQKENMVHLQVFGSNVELDFCSIWLFSRLISRSSDTKLL
jgi:hypothetical protein